MLCRCYLHIIYYNSKLDDFNSLKVVFAKKKYKQLITNKIITVFILILILFISVIHLYAKLYLEYSF